jgi:Uma2 family endonuclease
MSTTLPQTAPAAARLPRLVAGDRLSRAEFERRYTAMPDVKKAELIEGVVYMPSPVSNRHATLHLRLGGWLLRYETATPGVQAGDNATVRLDFDNEPQPDLYLRILPEHGGQSRTGPEYVEGAPELIVEVALSSASYDLHDKKNAYRRNGVREYVVLRVADEAVEWFVLREGRYELLMAGADGILRSEVFPGLWLDTKLALAGDAVALLASLERGLASAEHAAFVERLRRA